MPVISGTLLTSITVIFTSLLSDKPWGSTTEIVL